MKLLFQEPESEALSRWLSAREDLPKVTSQISVVEAVRVCLRLDTAVEPTARSLLAGLDLVPLSATVLDSATHVGTASLRSLDAVQLATALWFGLISRRLLRTTDDGWRRPSWSASRWLAQPEPSLRAGGWGRPRERSR